MKILIYIIDRNIKNRRYIHYNENRGGVLNTQEIGKQIKERRTFLKVDQKSLSEICGIAVHTISDIESGKGNPTVKVLSGILDALGMELSVQIKGLADNE